MEGIDILRTLKFFPGIIIGLTIHEFSHAYMARKCGDSTSEEQGRITLNPFKHIDLLGFVMLLVAGFGWAKPVQFNEKNLRNPRQDILKIAVAGPVSNALMAMGLSYIYVLVFKYIAPQLTYEYTLFQEVFIYTIYINWGLFIFNLIPIPPLDGSHLLLTYFKKNPVLYENLYKYGSFLFLGLIIGTLISEINFLPIWPAVQFLGQGFMELLGYSF
jgi:Zn-dependent protease